MATNCKMCGTPNQDGIQFCSACGNAMYGDPGQVRRDAPVAKGTPAKTMMFGQAPQIPPPAASPPAQQAPMIQQPAPMIQQQAPMIQQPAPMIQQPAPMIQQPAPMIQQPAPMINAGNPAAAPPVAAAAKKAPAKTMLGVHAVIASQTALSEQAQQQAPMAKPVLSAPKSQASDPLAAKHTVLGMPAVTAENVQQAVAQAKAATAQVPEQPAYHPRPSTEPLEAVPIVNQAPAPTAARPVPQAAATTPQPAYQAPRDSLDTWPDDGPPKKHTGIIVFVAIGAVVVLGAIGAILYLLVFAGASSVTPQVFPSPDGSNLTVVLTVPDAANGATLQVGTQTVQIIGGQARFDLPRASMQLGSNPVQVSLINPGKQPEPITFPIVLRHTASTDLSGLAAQDAFFVVNFQAAQGIQLAVNGQPVPLIGGVYAHKVRLADLLSGTDEGADNLMHTIPFQLTDETGVTEQGQQVVSIPLTKLQVDRPAPLASIATDEVACSGVAEPGATVSVNGSPVGANSTGFSTTIPLPAIGEHTISVVAIAPGKAPRTREIKISRVQSLEPAIAAWSQDLDQKLDFPKLARDANAHAGKKVKISGRIVNISTAKGVTAFLMYVGEGCPSGAKCAVYVAFRGETDAGIQSMVDVYATVRGTRDVDLKGGKKETMPALEAAFVVPSLAAKPRGRHRR